MLGSKSLLVIAAFLLRITQTQACLNIPSLESPVNVFNEVIQQMVTTLDFTNSYGEVELLDVLYDPTKARYQFIFRQNIGDSTIYTGIVTQYNSESKQQIVLKLIRSFEKQDLLVSLGYTVRDDMTPMDCRQQKRIFTSQFGNYAIAFLRKFQNLNSSKTEIKPIQKPPQPIQESTTPIPVPQKAQQAQAKPQ